MNAQNSKNKGWKPKLLRLNVNASQANNLNGKLGKKQFSVAQLHERFDMLRLGSKRSGPWKEEENKENVEPKQKERKLTPPMEKPVVTLAADSGPLKKVKMLQRLISVGDGPSFRNYRTVPEECAVTPLMGSSEKACQYSEAKLNGKASQIFNDIVGLPDLSTDENDFRSIIPKEDSIAAGVDILVGILSGLTFDDKETLTETKIEQKADKPLNILPPSTFDASSEHQIKSDECIGFVAETPSTNKPMSNGMAPATDRDKCKPKSIALEALNDGTQETKCDGESLLTGKKSGGLTFTCSLCNAVFGVKSLLIAHKRLHEEMEKKKNPASNDRCCKCKYCDRTFALERTLKIHLLEHCNKIPLSARRKLNFDVVSPVPKPPVPLAPRSGHGKDEVKPKEVGDAAVPSADHKSAKITKQHNTDHMGKDIAVAVDLNHNLVKNDAGTQTKMDFDICADIDPGASKPHSGVKHSNIICYLCKKTLKSIKEFSNHLVTDHHID